MKTFRNVILITLAVILLLFICLMSTYLIITRDSRLDTNKLINVANSFVILDDNGQEIALTNSSNKTSSITYDKLNDYTINAFVASEDRNFFKHDGLNYKRMLKAAWTNITSRSFKEGASTISQQLIKNTHLSSDKTLKRKLNEIKLTRSLEKKFNKEQILEMYLNTIYFGHSCYGIESASKFYFDKSAAQLDIGESAMLAGLLSSPNNYSPFKNLQKSKKRRDLVLKAMLECGYIDNDCYEETKESEISVQKGKKQRNSAFIDCVLDELSEIDFYNLKDGCIIQTSMNSDLQNYIEKMNFDSDYSIIISDNNGQIKAFSSSVGLIRRQPGSTIKPIAVYAPAIEEKIICPSTKILDEKINISGYAPENFDKKYRGYVSVAESIKNSLNIPAVKTLNYLTCEKSKNYLEKMNVSIDEEDKNLSLALGGMKYGTSIKELVDAYKTFSNGGNFSTSAFTQKVLKNDRELYSPTHQSQRVFSQGTASLINEMLIETAKSGTAKKLKGLDFQIAAKTGTCGNEQGNTDAWAIAYTSSHQIGVWLGDKNNERSNLSGGYHCSEIIKQIAQHLYSDEKPKDLDTTSGTQEVEIDLDDYTLNNKIIQADENCPKINKLKIKCLSDSIPDEKSQKFSHPQITTPSIKVNKNQVLIELCQTKYYAYLIKRAKNGENETIYDGLWKERIIDEVDEGCYSYSVTPYYINENSKKFIGEEVILPQINVSKQQSDYKLPDISQKDWTKL